jgi:pimeloyl-ACP methyl ester carboxylesterase
MIETNGISLYVEDHGDGTPVLMLHGWPDSARLWRHQVPVLAGRGYRVITPDLRGFGRSEQPAEVRSYSLRNVVGDITALLDALGVPEAATTGGRRWPGSPPSCGRTGSGR